jgi:PLP dependent protein
MSTLKHRLAVLHHRIHAAELAAERPLNSVKLLAVSKTQPATTILEAYCAGQRHFGENYLQEALAKQVQLSAFDIDWHFIGPIQSNKTRAIAEHFSWVHSVDRLKIAERLSEQRPEYLPPLNICLQVNISQEPSKSGIILDALPEMVAAVQSLRGICLRGVMAVPEPASDIVVQRIPFRQLFLAVKHLQHPELDTFSMGMSDDLEAAIYEGSTWVRVGTAVFGKRK